MAKPRNKYAGKEDVSQETVNNIVWEQLEKANEISETVNYAATKMRESVAILYEKRIPIDTEHFEHLNRHFIGEMDRKLKKVKQPSNGLKWYILMWTITLLSAFLSGYFIHEYKAWKKEAVHWYEESKKTKG